MYADRAYASTMPIHQELLSILICPKTKKPLRMATPGELQKVNDRIRAHQAKNAGGAEVKDALEEGLVPEGENLVYPVQQGIPILLIQEGIQL